MMSLTPFEKAEIEFARRTQFLNEDLHILWKKDQKERKKGERGPRSLSYPLFLETFLTSFRLAFVLRDERVQYLYRELTEEAVDAYWNDNRDLFTRYDGDSFNENEVKTVIAKRLREKEYLENVEKILLQLK